MLPLSLSITLYWEMFQITLSARFGAGSDHNLKLSFDQLMKANENGREFSFFQIVCWVITFNMTLFFFN